MKKLLLLFIPVFLVSCMGQIKIVRDDFKKADVVTMSLKEGSEESMFKGGGNAMITYSREIQNKVSTPTLMSFHITKGKIFMGGNQDLMGRAIVKINDASYDIGLGETSAVNVTTYMATPNYATGGAQITSSQHEEWDTKLFLNKKIEDAIKNCNSLAIRFYFGISPFTLQFNEKSIAKIKEYLSVKPE